MTMLSSIPSAVRARLGRGFGRVAVSLPALIVTRRGQRSVRVLNASAGGALIESPLPMVLGSEVVLSCGSIEVEAMVVWQKRGRCGLWFYQPLAERDVVALLARSDEAASRRRPRHTVN